MILTTDGTKNLCEGRHGAERDGALRAGLYLPDMEIVCHLSMVDEGSSPLWDGSNMVLLEIEGRDVLQDLIGNVGQLEPA